MRLFKLIFLATLGLFCLMVACKQSEKKVSIEEEFSRLTEGNEAFYIGKLGIVSDQLYLMKSETCVLMTKQKVIYSGGRCGLVLKVDGSEVTEVLLDDVNLDHGSYVYVGRQFFHVIGSDASGRRRGWKYKRGEF